MHCPRCRTVAEPGERRCVACGKRFRSGRLWTLSYVAIVAVIGFGLWYAIGQVRDRADQMGREEAARDAQPAAPRTTTTTTIVPATTVPDTTTSTPPTPQFLRPVKVVATGTAGPAVNSCGERTRYDAAFAADGDPSTAWRVAGSGVGQQLTLTFDRPVRLLQVGIIPGYTKVDPCSGEDRFTEHRRVSSVRWVFDGGATLDQKFADKPELQSTAVDVVTGTVTLQITGTIPGTRLDFTPISEVTLKGVPS